MATGEGQGHLAFSSPWSRKESDTTYQLNDSNYQECSIKGDSAKPCKLISDKTRMTITGHLVPNMLKSESGVSNN